ncbi:hypothetical protein BU25DRAFT_330450 [Macroventuria anomochaeta]|uniref:Uncharacterized protein n=1 Tax=Macroventuria anomochaeta TaxID=301207 RepID=A0ACB6SHX2_9PLEO|nr:uncharacterized protein BU25DRAFT_330450 [Macroventuria anomochaeta]KAF2632948.1 hypothetical protein BU25DRAFT_330450 [Macroventuria anomochaeta]
MPVPEVYTCELLYDVIKSSSQGRLRSVLYHIFATNRDAFDGACDMLPLQQGKLRQTTDLKAHDTTTVLHRDPVCGQCDKEYDTIDNKQDSCIWHDGDKSMKRRIRFTLADHCAEELDNTEENRKEFLQSFRWLCYDMNAAASGCKISVYRPDRTKRLRTTGL